MIGEIETAENKWINQVILFCGSYFPVFYSWLAIYLNLKKSMINVD